MARRKRQSGHQKLARRMAGIGPKAKLPPKGTPNRRAYDSAMRGQQRAEAAGKVNPKTGRPMQARPSRPIMTARQVEAAEARALRKPTVTVRNLSVFTSVNMEYGRRRRLGDVTMTRAQFRALRRLDRDEDDEMLSLLLQNVSDRIADLAVAPGVLTLDLSDVEFEGLD
jgi:hypothetical protein